MLTINKIVWFINVTGLLLGFSSCTNVQTRNTDQQDKTITDTTEVSDTMNESVMFLLPSPGEIILRFYTSDIQYIPELLNSPGNKDKYIGSTAQSLNLGIYIADMAYCALFERSTETIKYLESIQALSAESGISSNIFESLLTRSKANAGKLDSLVNISNESFTNMLEFLETGGKENTIALISSGAYIECLYIALQSINKYSENNETLEMLAEMKYPMDNLLGKAKSTISGENSQVILSYLTQISGIFDELETNSSKTVISQAQTGAIAIEGGEKIIITEINFNNLKNKVTEIRNTVVSF